MRCINAKKNIYVFIIDSVSSVFVSTLMKRFLLIFNVSTFKFILIYILDLCLRIRIYVHVKNQSHHDLLDLIVINSYFLNIESFYNRYTPHFRQMMVPCLFYTVYLMLSFFCYLRNSHNLMHDSNNYIKLAILRDPYLLLVPLSYFFPYQVLSSQLLYE
jgi:hypothetical protein